MVRKFVLAALSLWLLVNASGALAINEQTEKVIDGAEATSVRANGNRIFRYLLTPESKISYPFSNDTVGYTYYDYQHNDSQRRQMTTGFDGILHFTWMNSMVPDTGNVRYVDYNSLNNSGSWGWVGGMHVTPIMARGGFSTIDVLPDSREVIAYHRFTSYDWYTAVSIEKSTPGLGQFNHYDIPDSQDYGRWDQLRWPFVACSKVGDTAYIHLTNFSEISGAGYVRCFEDPISPETLQCQSPGWPQPIKVRPDVRLIPNKLLYQFTAGKYFHNVAAPVVTSPVSAKTAIAMVGADQFGEVYYVQSNNNGDDWMAGSNLSPIRITNYEANNWRDYWTLYSEIAAIYDYNDVLHVIWTTCDAKNVNSRTLWHWSSDTGIRKVTSNLVTSDCGAWNYGIAKMTMGVGSVPFDTAYNYLYVLYTRFSDNDVSAGGFANGDLALNVSSNGGLTWGPDINLTNTNSNGCMPNNCQSEHWASISERVDSFLNVQYVYDRDAGGIPQGEGTFTNNPIRHFKVYRHLVTPIPRKIHSPTSMEEPIRWAPNGGSKSDTLRFENTGTADLYVKISGPSFLLATPNDFIVPEGEVRNVNLVFSGAGLADTFLVDSLLIASNDSLVGGGAVYIDTEWVRVSFVVSDSFYYVEYDTCKRGPRLVVSNVDNIGAHSDSAGMFYKGLNYLLNGSAVMVTNQVSGYGNKGYSWFQSRADFVPEGHLIKTDYPNLKTTVYTGKSALNNWSVSPSSDFSVHWAWIGWTTWSKIVQFDWVPGRLHAVLIKNWWIPSLPPKWWMDVSSTLPLGGYFGIAGDWDVTADYFRRNKGGIIDSLNLVYLRQDTVIADKYYGGFQFLGSYTKTGSGTTNYAAPFAMHVGNNITQIDPFQGYNDDSLWKYMSRQGNFIMQDSAQDLNIIISAVEMLNPDTSTEIGVNYAAIISDSGSADLIRQAATLKKVKSGDSNSDGKLTVTDVVYLVNYLFKGGTEPWLLLSDCNNDQKVTVSDVVYLVNYLFKGGPVPVTPSAFAKPF